MTNEDIIRMGLESEGRDIPRDDIIRMAREANLHERVKDGVGYVVRIPNLKKLERFAALVAAAERVACANYAAEKCGYDESDAASLAAEIWARDET